MKKFIIGFLLLSVMLIGCVKQTVKVGEDKIIGQEGYVRMMPKDGEVLNKNGAKEIWLGVGPMNGKRETPASGVTATHVFADTTSVHTVQINIALASKGLFYEGWVKKPDTTEMISTGQFHSTFGDVRHALTFEANQDLSAYTEVLVTLEKDDGNTAPGTIVAEGALKKVERAK